ncbi:MAG: Crp/Fnr family transcriptional regulator [Bacteroidia bacterium]|nr:MAG: Crp/Fnr family transcriptional regulator [Bacteroidia bacterium]
MNRLSDTSNCLNCKHIEICKMESLIDKTSMESIHTTRVNYLRGETLCKEGGFSSCVKYILDGYVKVFVEGPDKKNIIVKIQKGGDFLGMSAVCGDATYFYSASAITDTLVCSIDRDSIVELLVANGDFALELTKWYCESYGKMFKKLKTIGFKNLHGRMADAILYLDREEYKAGNIYKYLSRTDLAELAGMPMESAVRVLSEFSESSIINISGKDIIILDHNLLNKISRGG